MFPLRSATSKSVCKELEYNVFFLFGVPKFVVCDNGPQFKSRELKALCDYHPQANPAERINQIIKKTLRAYVSENHRAWDSQLAKVACSIRTAQHEVLGVSSNYAYFGRGMVTYGSNSISTSQDCRDGETVDTREQFRKLREEIGKRLESATKKAAQNYKLRRRDVQFLPNELVWRRKFTF